MGELIGIKHYDAHKLCIMDPHVQIRMILSYFRSFKVFSCLSSIIFGYGWSGRSISKSNRAIEKSRCTEIVVNLGHIGKNDESIFN